MSEAQLLLLALAISTLGMASLSLTISAHWKQLFGERVLGAGPKFAMRAAAALLLGLGFLLCNLANPLTMAMLTWPMLLMIAAGLVAGMLSLHAHAQRRRAG